MKRRSLSRFATLVSVAVTAPSPSSRRWPSSRAALAAGARDAKSAQPVEIEALAAFRARGTTAAPGPRITSRRGGEETRS